jgi:ariadne-1
MNQLKEDAISLSRVRNRFSQTTERNQLGKVMCGLLPKLLQRLEGYSELTTTATTMTMTMTSVLQLAKTSSSDMEMDDVDSSIQRSPMNGIHHQPQDPYPYSSILIATYRKRAEGHIFGILSNATERLRGDSTIPTTNLVPVLLTFVPSNHPVVATWALALLQVFVPRLSIDSLHPTTIATLIQSLTQIHQDLWSVHQTRPTEGANHNIDNDDGNDEISTNSNRILPQIIALETRWVRVSWLLLDSIMIYCGHKPMVDWAMETFDPSMQSHEGPEDSKACSFRQRQTTTHRIVLMEESVKVIHLPCRLSDSINIDCATSNSTDNGIGIMNLLLDLILFWPDDSSMASSLSNTGLCESGLTRLAFRSKVSANNNTMGDVLTAEDNQVRIWQQNNHHLGLPAQFQRLVRPRNVVNTNYWSDISKVYLRYLKLACLQFAVSGSDGSLFTEQSDRALLLSIVASNHDSMHGRVAMDYLRRRGAGNSHDTISISVTTSALILILGENTTTTAAILDKFEEDHGTGHWERILGPRTQTQQLQRAALPWGGTSRVADYLLKVPVKWEFNSILNEAYATLLIELAVALSNQGETDYKFLSIQLVSCFYNQMKPVSLTVISKTLVAIADVLKVLVDQGAAEMDNLRTIPERAGELPLGVPAPFNQRNDLNRLLTNHRQYLNRKKMQHDNSMQARKVAYELIPPLSKGMFECEGYEPYELPNLLLQCTVHEDRLLEQYVIKALDACLLEYVARLDTVLEAASGMDDTCASFQLEATSLLPSLLEASCSEVVAARTVAMEWVAEVVFKIDAQAALYLSSRLVHDVDPHISKIASHVLHSYPNMVVDCVEDIAITFVDEGEDGTSAIKAQLSHRIFHLADTLRISHDDARILLFKHGFSISKVESVHRQDPENTLSFLGIVGQDDAMAKDHEGKTKICGICYDEMNLTSLHSLGCGHYFCQKCWRDYMIDASKIYKSTPLVFLDLRCPEYDCDVLVTPNQISCLAPHLLHTWNDAFFQTFVEQDDSFRFCPGPDCRWIAMASSSCPRYRPFRTATCTSCSTSFCFQCGESPHEPATCSDLREWRSIRESSGFWIKQNAKPCPGCNAPIEKYTGCNHMKCTKCKTDFCWLCLAQLNSHMERHICNHYDPVKSAEDDFERRALFTASRYIAHEDAEVFALRQSNNYQPHKLIEAFWFLNEDEDPEILRQALRTIARARCFLKHSYVALLGLRKDLKRLKTHEVHHSCLEVFTERLSQLAESNMHRLYLEQGEERVKSHFRRLAFYTISVARYIERICDLSL